MTIFLKVNCDLGHGEIVHVSTPLLQIVLLDDCTPPENQYDA
jgi:hypothetical protein